MYRSIVKYSLILLLALTPFAYNHPTSAENESVAIIGGGIAGIAAASFLKNSGVQVHLLEAEPKLGGNAQSMTVPNAQGENVDVDIGPQYLADGPWDLYIDFLKLHGVYNEAEMPVFTGGVTISNTGEVPYFVTPTLKLHKLTYQFLNKKCRYLWVFYRLNELANNLYKGDHSGYHKTIEQFLDEHFSVPDQETLLLPFLASVIGVNVDQARHLSALFVAKLFAFNGPLESKNFKVSLKGMGNLVEEIGQKLEQEANNIEIFRGAQVKSITRTNEGYRVKYTHETQERELIVDKLITATHPNQVTKILKDVIPGDVRHSLQNLEYFDVRIILHNSDRFNKGESASLYNIELDAAGNPNTTMQLDQINPQHFQGINKTWATEEVYEQLKEDGAILAEAPFQHPYVTPKFITHLEQIHSRLRDRQFDTLTFAGGWLEPAETQATSIYSAFKAVNRLFPLWTEHAPWRKTLNRSLLKPGNVYFSKPY